VIQSGNTVSQFSRDVKEYLDLTTSTPTAAGLPSDKRRDELEELVWKTLQDAAEFRRTEDAAKNARDRVNVMEVTTAIATVHLEVMKYQDKAAVGPLLDRVRAGLRELDKATGKSSEMAGE
jgi:hypothetical protein